MRSRLKSAGGFTLIEMMVVVAIIAVAATIAVPSMVAAIAEQKAQESALSLVRLANNARAASVGYGRAHLLVYRSAQSTFEVYRGVNNSCNNNDWNTITAGGCAGNDLCIDSLDTRALSVQTNNQREILVTTADARAQICYRPNGVTMWRRSFTANFTSENNPTIGGGFQYTFTRQNNNTGAQGVARRVVLPLGSAARVVR